MSIEFGSLRVDLGICGRWTEQGQFTVTIGPEPLAALTRHVEAGSRVYELFAIKRPGDLWNYLTVTAVSLPKDVQARFEKALSRIDKSLRSRRRKYPHRNRLPYLQFDSLFFYGDPDEDDTADRRWDRYRHSPPMKDFLHSTFEKISAFQREVPARDALFAYEVEGLRAFTHLYDDVPREKWLDLCRKHAPGWPPHTEAFYSKLQELLAVRAVHSVRYRGWGDHYIHRMMCLEQRLRADKGNLRPRFAMYLCSLGGHSNSQPWGAELWYFEEGLGPGELFIEDHCLGASVRDLIAMGRAECNFVLSNTDQGEIPGYTVDAGDGYFLYEKAEKINVAVLPQLVEERVRCRG